MILCAPPLKLKFPDQPDDFRTCRNQLLDYTESFRAWRMHKIPGFSWLLLSTPLPVATPLDWSQTGPCFYYGLSETTFSIFGSHHQLHCWIKFVTSGGDEYDDFAEGQRAKTGDKLPLSRAYRKAEVCRRIKSNVCFLESWAWTTSCVIVDTNYKLRFVSSFRW